MVCGRKRKATYKRISSKRIKRAMRKITDLTGQRFGILTVLSRGVPQGENKGRNAYWECVCDCGRIRNIKGSDLKRGQQSCGCKSVELLSKARTIDLSGKRFGRLTCIEKTGKAKSGNALWTCLCDCGKTTTVSQGNLSAGSVKSCGCFMIDRTRDANTKHGYSRSRLYRIWRGMKKRCLLPTDPAFSGYGARGISIYPPWMEFESFYSWAVTHGYAPHLTIERKNNDGNYEPGNCTWIPLSEQAKNRRQPRRKTL